MIKNYVYFNTLRVARERQELRENRWQVQGRQSLQPQPRLAPPKWTPMSKQPSESQD